MLAAEHGHVEIVQVLLDRGADVNALAFGHATGVKSESGRTTVQMYLKWTALIAARIGGHSRIEKLLIQAGAK